jgi:DNA-binding transcriptional LysR family regulator
MQYTLNQLHIFSKIVELQSVTKAAEELHLTQPAVSIQLKNFQNQFEIPLTEVIGRKIFITDFGKEIAIAAQKILEEVYSINYKSLAHKGLLSGRLKISIVSTGKYVMPYFLADFMKRNEGIELTIDVTNKNKVIDSLENNEVDFSLVSVLPNTIEVDKVELMQNKLFLVGDKFSAEKHNNFEKSSFYKLPMIYREKGSGTRYTMEKFLQRNDLPTSMKMELTTNEAVKQAIIAGLGYSIMPLIGIKNELRDGDLHIIPFKGLPIKSQWNLIWMKQKKFTPIASAFLEFIKNEKARIIKDKFEWFEDY